MQSYYIKSYSYSSGTNYEGPMPYEVASRKYYEYILKYQPMEYSLISADEIPAEYKN